MLIVLNYRKLWSYRSGLGCLCCVRHHSTWPPPPGTHLLNSNRLTNPLLLIAMGFLFGGFAAISKFGTSFCNPQLPSLAQETIFRTPAPESAEIAGTVITQKSLYITLFVIGIPLLWISSPISTFFWIIGASGVLIFGHACLMEPGIESEYAAVQDAV